MHIYIYVTVCIVFYPETPFILLLVDPVDLSSGSHRGPVLFSAAVVGACRAASRYVIVDAPWIVASYDCHRRYDNLDFIST